MAETTKIAWTKSTLNPWLGCTKVSPECDHCYAEGWAKRSGLVIWGQGEPRRRTSDAKWKEPRKWDKLAEETGEFWPVFCGSLCDVGEDNPQLIPWREDLCRLIEDCRNLTWQLLTKRPQNYRRLFPKGWLASNPHVWAGTTVGTPDGLWRIDALKGCGAETLFLSAEPLLAALPTLGEYLDGILQVIVGGESGPGSRPCNVAWIRDIVGQCKSAGVAAFVKQMGAYCVGDPDEFPSAIHDEGDGHRHFRLKDRKGADPAEWPEDLRVREFPEAVHG